MQALVWVGALFAVAGLCGLAWCIRSAMSLRREAPDAAEARKALARLQALNLASVSTGFLGLAMVVAGVILA